jgi:hypothetical protein
MWILFSFRPRTLPDFVRMCRLYGMTMADVRMQEGWAMAHWLHRLGANHYVLETDATVCNILIWADGGITRSWQNDSVPDVANAEIWTDRALPDQHLIALASIASEEGAKARVHAFRYRVGNLPFSHYFPDDGESLAITYRPPKRDKNKSGAQAEAGEEGAAEEQVALEQMAEEADATPTAEVVDLPEGAKIKLMAPRGMTLINAKLFSAAQDASISWTRAGKERKVTVPAKGRTKKVCDVAVNDLQGMQFTIE